MSKSPKISVNLIGIAAISAAAFIGFGAIFESLELGIGTEAVTAAFGALFVLLSTKFLMEQESESRIQSEKRTKIFERHLEEYREAAACFLSVIDENRVTASELHKLLERHSRLILLGDESAIEASNNFIKKCQQIVTDDKSESDEDMELTHLQVTELWGIAFDFLGAARQSLELPHDNFGVKINREDFVNVIKTQSVIDKTDRHRQALQDPTKWIEAKKLDASIITDLSELLKALEGVGLHSKVTKSQISFYNPNHPRNARVIYINNYSAKDDLFNLSLNGQLDLNFFKTEAQKLGCKTSVRDVKGKHDLVIWLPSKTIRNGDLDLLIACVQRYIEKFHS